MKNLKNLEIFEKSENLKNLEGFRKKYQNLKILKCLEHFENKSQNQKSNFFFQNGSFIFFFRFSSRKYLFQYFEENLF